VEQGAEIAFSALEKAVEAKDNQVGYDANDKKLQPDIIGEYKIYNTE
jgi:hypothetical protein